MKQFARYFLFFPHSNARIRLAASDLSGELLTGEKRHVRQLTLLMFGFMCGLAGCSRPTDQSATNFPPAEKFKEAGAAKAIDTCSLLTSQEIETVMGASLRNTKPSVNATGGTTVSQCYFLLPVAADSVVLTVTQMTGATNSPDVKESWEHLFHGDREEETNGKKKRASLRLPRRSPASAMRPSGRPGASAVLFMRSRVPAISRSPSVAVGIRTPSSRN